MKQAMRGWRLAAAAGAFAVFSLLSMQFFGEHGYLRLRAQSKEMERIEKDVQQLKDENQRLEKRVKDLRTDPNAIEAIAREEMKLVRPGEVVYTDPSHK